MFGVKSALRTTRRNVTAFLDGARYPRSLRPPTGSNVLQNLPQGRLATYFDDHTEGYGLWKWRHYFPAYERHLARFVDEEVHVAEIGVFSGGSLEMWKYYFGARVHVYGIDIEERCRKYAADRVEIFIGDQADPRFWASFVREVPRLDVVIDDGGHEAHQQVTTLKATLPAISPGGVYICEDSRGAGHPFHAFIDGLSRGLHISTADGSPNTLNEHIGSIHRYPFLTVIEKPLLPVPRFQAPRHGTRWEPFL